MPFRPQLLFDPLAGRRLVLADAEVRGLLDPRLAYEAVGVALTCHARRDCAQPLKPYVYLPNSAGRIIAMPAYVGDPVRVAGLKWIAGCPANVERGLPRASGDILLNSVETGLIFAQMDCAAISAFRTAAVAALACDHLAPPPPRRVALLGAGPISRAVLEALGCGDRSIERVTVFDPRADRLRQFVAGRAAPGRPDVRAAASVADCVAGANVIITATTGAREYLERRWVSPGGLIVALSLEDCTPDLFLSADKVVVDDFDQCNREDKLLHRLVRAGLFSRDRVSAELGEVVAGLKPGRTDPGERIYVNPMGMAVEDLALAKAVYDRAVSAGAGRLYPDPGGSAS
jgi:ornithine cyclodeaminase